MEKLIFKKMKKVILIFSLVVPFIVTNTEFVKAAESNYKINEIINEDGVAEIVIRVLENGEYITIPFQSQDVASTKASTCQHMNLSAYNSVHR